MSLFNNKQHATSLIRAGILLGSLCLCLPLAAANVEDRLAKVERLVQSQGLIQLMNQVDALQLELQKLRGEIEFQTHTLDQIKQRQRELYIDVDRRLQSIETRGVANTAIAPSNSADAVQTISDGNPPLQVLSGSAAQDRPALPGEAQPAPLTIEVHTPQAEPAIPGTADSPAVTTTAATGETTQVARAAPDADPAVAEQAYKKAFDLLKTGQHEPAMKGFAKFVEDYPESSYAPNAQYWLGEAYYVKQRFNEAIAEFRLLVENYPESQKLTHSLLKIGYSLHELKQYDEATRVLQDLQSRYPGTSAARYAGERLQRIKADQEAAPAVKTQG